MAFPCSESEWDGDSVDSNRESRAVFRRPARPAASSKDGPYRPAAATCPRGDGYLWEERGLKDVCWQCEDGEGDYHSECDDRRIDPEFAMIGFSKTNGVLLLAINELDLDKSVWASTRR